MTASLQELRDGLEAHNLLFILEPDEDEADSEDLSQLLNMVFSPDAGNDIMLGSAVPPTHSSDDELIGGSDIKSGDQVINEDLGSLQDLLSQVERGDGDEKLE